MPSFEPARALRHPLWGGALLLLAVNDHLLKGAELLPGWFTGKASDVAGLVVAPALLATLVRARTRVALAVCHLAPVLALVALKLVPGLAAAVVAAAARVGETWAIVPDPTDLLALPAALVAWRVLVPTMAPPTAPTSSRGRRDPRQTVLAAAGALACCATSRVPPQAPSIHRGQVVVQSFSEGELHRFDARSGQPRGAPLPFDDVYLTEPVLFDGAVWVSDANGVRALDLQTGALRWSHVEPGLSLGTVAGVDVGSVYVLAPCFDSLCDEQRWVAIDRASHRIRWTARGQFSQPPALGSGAVALAEQARLVVRDAASSEVRWTRTFEHPVQALAIDADQVWVVIPETGAVHALAAGDGTERARFELGPSPGIGPRRWSRMATVAAGGGRLFVALRGEVLALAPGARDPAWRVAGRGVTATADIVVIDGEDGMVGLEASTGRRLWQAPAAGWGGVVAGEGVLASRDGDDDVTVRDLETGRLLVHFDLEEGKVTTSD